MHHLVPEVRRGLQLVHAMSKLAELPALGGRFRVAFWGLGFRVQGLGFRVMGP